MSVMHPNSTLEPDVIMLSKIKIDDIDPDALKVNHDVVQLQVTMHHALEMYSVT